MKKKSLKVKIIDALVLLIIIIIGLFMYFKYVGSTSIIVKEKRLSSELIPSNFSGVKVLFFTDLLYGSSMNENELESLTSIINDNKVDIIIFGGALVNGEYSLTDSDKEVLKNYLTNMNATLGKYSVNDKYSDILTESGFTIKNNETIKIYNEEQNYICLTLLGSYNKSEYNFDNIINCENTYNILTTHEPDIIDTIMNNIAPNIALSGNSLGGEVNLPFTGPFFKYEGSLYYYEEEYSIENTMLYISSGLGIKKSFIRMFNNPSVTLFRLKSL